jgi:hypothetical protein
MNEGKAAVRTLEELGEDLVNDRTDLLGISLHERVEQDLGARLPSIGPRTSASRTRNESTFSCCDSVREQAQVEYSVDRRSEAFT